MTDPHDVMVAVAGIMNRLEHRPHNYDIGKALETAILAERQRCADIAERLRKENDTGSGFDNQPARVTAYNIREAILNP